MIVEFGEDRRVQLIPGLPDGGDPAGEAARIALAVLDGVERIEVVDARSAARAAVPMGLLIALHEQRRSGERSAP